MNEKLIKQLQEANLFTPQTDDEVSVKQHVMKEKIIKALEDNRLEASSDFPEPFNFIHKTVYVFVYHVTSGMDNVTATCNNIESAQEIATVINKNIDEKNLFFHNMKVGVRRGTRTVHFADLFPGEDF